MLKTNSNFQTGKGRGYSREREREQNGQGIRKETNTEVEPNLDALTFARLSDLEIIS